MSVRVVLRPEARAEFDDAFDWYERQRPGLALISSHTCRWSLTESEPGQRCTRPYFKMSDVQRYVGFPTRSSIGLSREE